MKRNKIILFGLIALCVINLLFMHINVLVASQIEEPLDGVSWVDNICRVLIDIIVVFTTPLLLTRGRIKISILFSFLVTYIWSFSNVIYSRFFFHYITLSSIGEAGALADGLVYKSIFAGMRYSDSFYVVVLFVFLLLFRRCVFPVISLGTYVRYGIVCLFSIYIFDLFSHAVYCTSHSDLRYWGYYKRRVGRRVFGQNHFFALPIYAHFHNGSIKSLLLETFQTINGRMELSENQKKVILQALNNSKVSMRPIQKRNTKNLIFILIESQMSFVIDKTVEGKAITPTLNALKSDSSVYYNGHMRPNITMGESSDGQYIYMTGVLPLRSMITVSKACKKKLPGLPRQLKKIGIFNSRMVLPTSPSLWRQDEMCQQYGFEQLYSSNDYPGEHVQTLTDEQVFELASLIDSKGDNSPFFSIILTASMHQPYNKMIDSSFQINDKFMNDELKCYINACHYTDKAIGNYLQSLRNNDMYSNSLIIIASDHHVHSTDFGGSISTEIPLFIINGNFPSDIYTGPCNQLDLFTTIINLMNIPDSWPGLGASLLNANYKNLELKDRWDISEWILLGDYYESYCN